MTFILRNYIGLPCPWCDKTMGYGGLHEPTRDHLFPKSKGGHNRRPNIVIVCSKCNNDKRSKTLIDWLQRLEEFGDARARWVRRFMKRNRIHFGYGGFNSAPPQS